MRIRTRFRAGRPRARAGPPFYALPIYSTYRCLLEMSSKHALTLQSLERGSARQGRDGAIPATQPRGGCEHRSVAGDSGTPGVDMRMGERRIGSQQQR